MVQLSFLLSSLTVAAVAPLAFAVDVTRDPALDASLFTAATQLDRLKLLPGNSPWFFDFNAQQPFANFDPKVGGGVANANAATFPATVGNGMTSEWLYMCPFDHHVVTDCLLVAMLNLAPCGMLPPHYHPRASNYVVAVRGNTTTYMYEENGATLVTEILLPGQMTIFPQASMHMMVNNGKLFQLSRIVDLCLGSPANCKPPLHSRHILAADRTLVHYAVCTSILSSSIAHA